MAARIGKYDVLAKLSTGGMAELYLAATTGPGGFRKLAAVTLQQIVRGEVPPPRAPNPRIPPGLSDVVMRAISRRRDDRYPSGREVARAIKAVSRKARAQRGS